MCCQRGALCRRSGSWWGPQGARTGKPPRTRSPEPGALCEPGALRDRAAGRSQPELWPLLALQAVPERRPAAVPAHPPLGEIDFSGAGPAFLDVRGKRWASAHTRGGGTRRNPGPPTHSGAGTETPSSGSRGPSPVVRVNHPPPRWPRQAQAAPPAPPDPQRGPNSIAHGLMNSRALIGSPGALWIYACRLSSRGRRAPPGVVSEGVGLGAGQGLGPRGFCPRRRVGALPETHLGTASPVPPSQRSGASLPAPGSPELPLRPHRPKPAPNPRAPARLPSPPPQVRDARGGRPARAVRLLPLSLRIPLIRGLCGAPRLPGCRGRPVGVLETVPSLSPFIKRPWAP